MFVKQIVELFRGNVAAVIEKVLQFVEVGVGVDGLDFCGQRVHGY